MIARARKWIAFSALLPSAAFAAVTVHTSDFIPDNTRTNFNGFEAISPLDSNDVYAGGSYTEDGITVVNTTIHSVANTNIWTACAGGPGLCFNPTDEGTRSWYPSGGDLGYTRITRTGGSDFVNIGFILGSGFGTADVNVYYELAENGTVVSSGQLSGLNNTPSYLGFSGGGFNEIRVRNASGGGPFNALAVDSIELSSTVPEPSTWGVLAGGIAMLLLMRSRRTR